MQECVQNMQLEWQTVFALNILQEHSGSALFVQTFSCYSQSFNVTRRKLLEELSELFVPDKIVTCSVYNFSNGLYKNCQRYK